MNKKLVTAVAAVGTSTLGLAMATKVILDRRHKANKAKVYDIQLAADIPFEYPELAITAAEFACKQINETKATVTGFKDFLVAKVFTIEVGEFERDVLVMRDGGMHIEMMSSSRVLPPIVSEDQLSA